MKPGITIRRGLAAALGLAAASLQIGVIGSSAPATTRMDTTASGTTTSEPRSAIGATVPQFTATLEVTFVDPLNGYHPMGITSDGTYFYTTNGGGSGGCVVNTFDLAGTLVRSTPCSVDNRDISLDPTTGVLYAKSYDTNMYRIDPVTGSSVLVGAGWFSYSQSSPALSPNRPRILEHESGTVRVIRCCHGNLLTTENGFLTGDYPSNEAVAIDGAGRIMTWDSTTVYVQDIHGTLLGTVAIPFGQYGFALSFANGLLFTADDVGSQGTATWYGYAVSP